VGVDHRRTAGDLRPGSPAFALRGCFWGTHRRGHTGLGRGWVWFGSGRTRGLALLVLSAVALGLGFLQATTGTYGPLQAHVPLAMVLTGLVAGTAIMAWR